MTACVVAPLPLHSAPDIPVLDNSAEARKRRREILSTQRIVGPEGVTSQDAGVVANARKRKMSEESDKPVKHKKPQMKYEPEVPMSKEEAAVWRREQRRKRNRESAAASRQRQRDRITELEGEVQDWKNKFDSTLDKIREMEKLLGLPATSDFIPVPPVQTMSRPETPEPKAITITPRGSPTSHVTTDDESEEGSVKKEEEQEMEPLPSKMTSRQAVKITGDAPNLPLLFQDPILPPQVCLSDSLKIDPIDSSLFPMLEEESTTVLDSPEHETEFGEFLLDAVDWL